MVHSQPKDYRQRRGCKLASGIKVNRHKISGCKVRTSHIVLKISVIHTSVVFFVVLGAISNFWSQLDFITQEGMGN
jgi:hypothetical protein